MWFSVIVGRIISCESLSGSNTDKKKIGSGVATIADIC